MIVLRIFLGIIWFFITLICFTLCGIHIQKMKAMRILASIFLGLSILLSYFTFPVITFLIMSVLELLLYVLYACSQAQNARGKLPEKFWSWIFVKEEDVMVSLVFPIFLIRLVIFPILWIISIKKKFRPIIFPLLKSLGKIDIEVETKDAIVSIHI